MKSIIILILSGVLMISVQGQNLIDFYKKGDILLVPDSEYGKDNNWDTIFRDDVGSTFKRPFNRRSMVILPDGSVVLNHNSADYYTRFTPEGKFEKEFILRNSKGEKYKKIRPVAGIIDNNIFFTELDNMGNMICLDLNGKYIKTLKLDYMARQIIPLTGKKFAVAGWVIHKKQFRDFVVLVDFETNAQKFIWEYLTARSDSIGHNKMFNYGYEFKERGAVSFNTMPFSKEFGLSSPPQIAWIRNRLIVAIPATGEILIYDINGKLLSKSNIDWERKYISVEEQKIIQKNAIEHYKKIESPDFAGWVSPAENRQALDTIIKWMEEDLGKISEPIPYPYFTSIIKDSDGNLLFFEFPPQSNSNKFNVWVYENTGKFACQSSFQCDEFDLIIKPSNMQFHKGFIYSLQYDANSQGGSLRLVRFKITNDI